MSFCGVLEYNSSSVLIFLHVPIYTMINRSFLAKLARKSKFQCNFEDPEWLVAMQWLSGMSAYSHNGAIINFTMFYLILPQTSAAVFYIVVALCPG